ncbi:MAG: KOW motif-containing protein [Bdellovibrionaceae bacterium]|nr:KOW motif-containing protein [Bdellovibrionales bacterium]MCB9085989.1 KOW motif-containing protein [Pseudobdellovibrionaceae bacterium]
MKLKIKKGATVEVTAGADRGKRGTVLEIDKGALKIRVQGVRMQTHFDKQDGLNTKEGFLDYSNVKLIEQAAAKKAGGKKKKASARK